MAARSQLQIFLWAQKKLLNTNVWNYSNFTKHIPHNMEMCRWFFKVLLKLKMAATDQFQFFEVAKTQNLNRKLLQFYYHIPNDMEMCMWFFQGFTEIQNGHHAWTS